MRKTSALFLSLALLLCSCGKPASSVVVSEEPTFSSSETTSEEVSISSSEEETEPVVEAEPKVDTESEEEKKYITDMSLIPADRLYNTTLNSKDMSMKVDYEGGNCFIIDGDKIVYFYFEYPDPCSIEKKDMDHDGPDEYIIEMRTGHGTGYYNNSLIFVKEGNNEPVAEISGLQISDELNESISFNWDEKYATLTILENEEILGNLFLYRYLEDNEFHFKEAVIGDIVEVRHINDTYWIEADVGIITEEVPWPQYEYTASIAFPAFISDNLEITYGEKVSKTYCHENPYASVYEIGEIIYEDYMDITHNGSADRIVVFVPTDWSMEDLLSGVNGGVMYVYEGYEDGTFGDFPVLGREFAISHVGNGQMITTTVNGNDYLVELSFWAGQGEATYSYRVLFENRTACVVVDSYFAEGDYDAPAPEEFREGLSKWLNESSVLLYAADIDSDPALMYSTSDKKLSPEDYLGRKK